MYLQSGVRSVSVKQRTKSDCETWSKNARSYCHARLMIIRKISVLCVNCCVSGWQDVGGRKSVLGNL